MATKRVTSSIFIGRTAELKELEYDIFTAEPPAYLINIHTNGVGGIGKTTLLQHVKNSWDAKPEQIVCPKDIIDFYSTENRTKLGVLNQIARNLSFEGGDFGKFHRLLVRYEATSDVNEQQNLFPHIEAMFRQEYENFAQQESYRQRLILLFFDSFEFLQTSEIVTHKEKHAESTEFSSWVENELFSTLTFFSNIRLIVAGRFPLTEKHENAKTIALTAFSLSDAIEFWQNCFHVSSKEALVERFGGNAIIEKIYTLTEGRPIRLALFVDWLNFQSSERALPEMIAEIENQSKRTYGSITSKQRELFEERLVKSTISLTSSEGRAIAIMAIAYRRMTPEIFSVLTDLSKEESQQILEKLKPLAFIKVKPQEEALVLHDDMRYLIVRYWWKKLYREERAQKDLAGRLVHYYGQLLETEVLLQNQREMYISEFIGYGFLLDFEDGLRQFCREFDVALEEGRKDYADLLLREAETFLKEQMPQLPFSEYLYIPLRRIRYYLATQQRRKASRLMEDILTEHNDEFSGDESEIKGLFLVEQGEIARSFENFKTAEKYFREANDIFYLSGDKYWYYRTMTKLGYIFYLQSNFTDAIKKFTKSCNGFYRLLSQNSESLLTFRELLQGFQLAIGNLAGVLSYTGKFEQAISRAEITRDIVVTQERYNLEIARACATLGHVSAVAGDAVNATHSLEEAEGYLQNISSPLIEGRIGINAAFLEYRIINEAAYILEYYRAEEFEQVLKIPADNEKETEKRHEEARKAKTRLEEAIKTLTQKGPIKKELADAYYVLGELNMVTPLEGDWEEEEAAFLTRHWEEAEAAFVKALKLGRASGFLYRVIDTLESLVTLSYFRGSLDIEKYETELWKEMEEHRITSETYPELFAKYEITSGDRDFDEGIFILRSSEVDNFEGAIKFLEKAFKHYVKAVCLMERFNEVRYYVALLVFFNRLDTLFAIERQHHLSDQIHIELEKRLNALWLIEPKKQIREHLGTIFQATYLLNLKQMPQQLNELYKLIDENLKIGRFSFVALLNNCVMRIYRLQLASDLESESYRESLIIQLNRQISYCRSLNDNYQASNCLKEAKKEVKRIKDQQLRRALTAYNLCSEGTMEYRRGEYGRLLEMYLQDNLSQGHEQFELTFPGAMEHALRFLQDGERKSLDAIGFWRQQLAEAIPEESKDALNQLIERYTGNLGEIRFRIGELLMLEERFFDENNMKGAISYLEEAIKDSLNAKEFYRYYNAMQSFINALYFAGKYEDAYWGEKRSACEDELKSMELSIEDEERFLLTKHSFDKLRSKKIPGHILKALKDLQDKEFLDKNEFLHAIEKEIEEEYTASHKKLIFEHAQSDIKFPSIIGRWLITKGDVLFSLYFSPEPVRGNLKSISQYVCKELPPSGSIIRRMLTYYVKACNFMAQHSSINLAAAVRVLQRRIQLIADIQSLNRIQEGLEDVWNEQNYLQEGSEELTLIQFADVRRRMIEDGKN